MFEDEVLVLWTSVEPGLDLVLQTPDICQYFLADSRLGEKTFQSSAETRGNRAGSGPGVVRFGLGWMRRRLLTHEVTSVQMWRRSELQMFPLQTVYRSDQRLKVLLGRGGAGLKGHR